MCLHCHVVTVAVEVKDLDALEAACKRLGWEFRRGQTRFNWWGKWYDDSPVPRNLFADEAEYHRVVAMGVGDRTRTMQQLLSACDHAIHVPGYTREIGVKKVGGRWELVWDWAGDLTRLLGTPEENAAGTKLNPLPQAYAVELARHQARARGLTYQEHPCENGDVVLRVRV